MVSLAIRPAQSIRAAASDAPAASIGVDEFDTSFTPPPTHADPTPPPEPAAPTPLPGGVGDVRDRLDDATWIGRVGPGFSFLTDLAPGAPAASQGAPDGEPHFTLFRFEVRVGDRVRFRLRAGPAGDSPFPADAPVSGVARLRLFDAHGRKLGEGQDADGVLHWPGHEPADCKLKYTFHDPGVYHLGVWTSGTAAAGRVAQLRITYARLDLPDLVATAVSWDPDTHGLRVEYEVADADRRWARPAGWGPGVAIYWVDWGCRRLGRVRHPAIDRHNADTRLTPGPHTLLVPRAAFPEPPSAATGVEVCLNGDRAVPERDPTNNVKFTGLSLGRRRRTADKRPAGGSVGKSQSQAGGG